LISKLYDHLYKGKANKENKIEKPEESKKLEEQRKPNFFERKKFVDYSDQL
jgi:hypothetical protein